MRSLVCLLVKMGKVCFLALMKRKIQRKIALCLCTQYKRQVCS